MRIPEPDALAREREQAFTFACTLLNPFGTDALGLRLPDSATAARQIYEFACFHGVRPALFKALSLHPDLPPAMAELRARLGEFQTLHRFEILQMTGQIVALTAALRAAGIEALFFKGAMLGEQIYGGAQHREFNDIDLLVRPATRDAAIEVLGALNFRPIVVDAAMRRGFFDYLRQHPFRSSETGAVVDLHWDFVGTGPFPVTAEQALSSRTRIQLGGVAIPVPSRDTQALILAGHGHKENWASFGWILDFATFAAVNPDMPWERLAHLAREQRCLEPLLDAILLVRQVFRHTIDEPLAVLGSRLPHLARNVNFVAARCEQLTERDLADELMGGFRLCETHRQKFNMAFSLLLTSSIGDFEALPLPSKWWWVYRMTRPLRLFLRKIGGSKRKLTSRLSSYQ